MEKLIILLFCAFVTWHSSCWLSETFHAVSKDYFSMLTRLLYSKIVILLNIMKLGSLKRGKHSMKHPQWPPSYWVFSLCKESHSIMMIDQADKCGDPEEEVCNELKGI